MSLTTATRFSVIDATSDDRSATEIVTLRDDEGRMWVIVASADGMEMCIDPSGWISRDIPSSIGEAIANHDW